MKVFCDYIGHADLYYSMHLLFEQRLGGELYRPVGTQEFSDRGIFTSTLPQEVGPMRQEGDVTHIPMHVHQYEQKAIDWQGFLARDFDVVVTTYWKNESPLANLVREHAPNAKFVRQIANIHEQPGACPNVLLATMTQMPPHINMVRYHPEHQTEYCFDTPRPNHTINSFYNNVPTYASEVASWQRAKQLLPEFTFKMYGHANDDGSVPQQHLPDYMKQSMFIWHTKPCGCCGYVAREALACGRPLIVKKQYARQHKTLAIDYLRDGVNCIDIDPSVRSLTEAAKLIREWAQPGVYERKCEEVRAHFDEAINFEREAQAIKAWIDNIRV